MRQRRKRRPDGSRKRNNSSGTTSTQSTTSTEDTESDNSLPELVSNDAETSADDSGYAFLNTPPSTEEEDVNTEDEEKEKQAMYQKLDRIDEEASMQELTIEQILNMEDPNYKPPTPCIGLTCPLTG